MFDFFAGRIENRYPPAGKVNVALVVNGHTVGAHRAEKLFVRELSVFIYFIYIRFSVTEVGYIKQFAVG